MMDEYEDELKKALVENVQFKAEKADALRKETSTQFRSKMKWAERIMWVYLLACVMVGVSVLNQFMASRDMKTLITCVLVLLVVYETTVLLKLWFAVAHTKLSVLKEVKQLRLEVSQLASAAGVTAPADVLLAKYEPMRGASKLERRAWLATLVVVAMVASSVARGEYDWLFGSSSGRKLSADTLVTLASDGRATSVTKITRTHSSVVPMTSFPFHAPKSWIVRWVDARGCELPYTTTPHGTHIRYDVSLLENVIRDERIVHTRMAQIPEATTQADGVWTYASDEMYGFDQNEFTTTVLLPEGAVMVSAEPRPVLEFTSNGRPALHFQATRKQNKKFEFNVQYRLAAESVE